jgi:hypothetical protein
LSYAPLQIFWNAFLSTLSHAPVVDAGSLDALQAWTAEQLPHPLHEQAAAIADTLYSATRPLHEQAAQFAEALKLPQVCAARRPAFLLCDPACMRILLWRRAKCTCCVTCTCLMYERLVCMCTD